jgi:hypothetical protein
MTMWVSAGVVMFEHSLADGDAAVAWRLAPEPTVRIGAVDGQGPEMLYRVTAAVRLRDGRLVVVNEGSAEVRWYHATGDHDRSSGRRGEGPGEFRRLAGLVQRLPGDTVVVHDGALRRVTTFGPDGVMTDMLRLEPLAETTALEYVGRLRDGTHVAAHTVRREAGASADGWRERVAIHRHDADGHRMNLIAVVDGRARQPIVRGGGQAQVLEVPHAGRLHVLLDGDTVVVLHSLRHEVRRYTPDGRLVRVVRRLEERVPLPDAVRDAHPPALFPGLVLPEAQPSFGDARLGADGVLWLAAVTAPGSDAPVRWRAYDRDGFVRAAIDVPTAWSVLYVGSGEVIALVRDELRVEFVQVHTIATPDAGEP